MKLEGDYLFEASVPEVWSALFDPVILAAVMPGCEKLELVDGSYIGDIKVKVGPIQGKFTGKVDLTDKDEPHSYKMTVDGRGAPGFVKAVATVKLAAEGTGTRVSYDTDAQIGGKIASVGQRLIDASARAIVAQSLEGLHTNIKLRAKAYRDAGVDPAAVAPAATTAAESEPDVKTADAFPTAVNSQVTDVVAPPAVSEAKTADAFPTAVNSQITDAVAPAAASAPTADLADLRAAAAEARAAAAELKAAAADARSAVAARPAPAPAPPPVAFTPVKVKQSDLANAVAKEVASSMFPRSVLVAIILVEALVIVWLLIRH
jgi:carbon monoxide dehydrogenase subunit G